MSDDAPTGMRRYVLIGLYTLTLVVFYILWDFVSPVAAMIFFPFAFVGWGAYHLISGWRRKRRAAALNEVDGSS